jgi:pimeloyl-ACP methyl ester carboxylesterase
MRTTGKPCRALFGLIGAVALLSAPLPAKAQGPASSVCASPEQNLNEQGFVEIGGIQQWITIKGRRCDNPVVLFLHGGPGNTLSPYADAIYGSWTNEFTLVQWDQRGAGRTYGHNPSAENEGLSIERMSADGVELATYLIQHLGVRKIILMGSSWGSILGVHMAHARPDLFHAYVGTSQVVSYRQNQSESYDQVLVAAAASADIDTLTRLEGLGRPPWTNPRSFGVVRRAVRQYEALSTEPFPAGWWQRSAEYAGAQDLADYEAGEVFSFLQYVGLNGDGMFSRVELAETRRRFEIPIFIVQGAEDLLTTADVTRRWFDTVEAPTKALVLVPRAGHDPNQLMVEAQLTLLQHRVRPLIDQRSH